MFDNTQLFSGDKFNVRKQTHLLILQLFDHVHYRKHAIRTWELITDTSKVYSICFLFLNLADILSLMSKACQYRTTIITEVSV